MAKYLDNPDDYFRARRQEEEAPLTLNATEARQGSWGRPVFYVLVVGLILAMFAWWASENYGARIAPPATDQTTTSSVGKDPMTGKNPVNDNQPAGQPVQKSPAIQDSTKM